ncbi:MAG: YggS family pyridoxal phosphate enzyme [Micavibrio sp. TMED27]|nr:YggS family pyridoxal phosphate-dependent enzyme [Micavibrio sp.]OUT92569.1 MAG: YggS family pyridoxal phosphate enzyme [Micavibrio sp. TMED27]|tara:strand:+ start:2967 stop:3641 length:675 start_codon:yes stop_codon:yes gene_type:complete
MSIRDNLNEITGRIARSAEKAGRNPQDVRLVAVSKVQPEERIIEALEAGHRLYGENRVQEAQMRWSESGFRDQYPDLTLHLIGPLQTNKVKDAVSLFDVIETVDREKLAKTLAKEMEKQSRSLPCFIQVNTGEEEQKAGILPSALSEFYEFCVQECGLNIIGLMCIPPVDDPPALHFAFLKKLADKLGLKELSMGMSSDYEWAVAHGASYVRVGTGVFGARDYS